MKIEGMDKSSRLLKIYSKLVKGHIVNPRIREPCQTAKHLQYVKYC